MSPRNTFTHDGPAPDSLTVKVRMGRKDTALREWVWRHPGSAPGVLRDLLRQHLGEKDAPPEAPPSLPAKTQAPAPSPPPASAQGALSSAERMRMAKDLISKASQGRPEKPQ